MPSFFIVKYMDTSFKGPPYDVSNFFNFIKFIRCKNNPHAIFVDWCRYNSKFLNNHFPHELYGRGTSVGKLDFPQCYKSC